MEVFGFAGDEFFHQGKANALGNAPFNLAFDQFGIDRLAHIMGGGDPVELDGAKCRINGQFGNLCAKAVLGIGRTLAFIVLGRRWRIVGFLGYKHITAWVPVHCGEVNLVSRFAIGEQYCAIAKGYFSCI